MRRLCLLVAGAALLGTALFTSPAYALDVPAKPTQIPIVDQTNTLSEQQQNDLAGKIAKERAATNNQLAILMIPTLDGDALEDYSIKVARQWGVGGKERDSGVLILVVKNDRKVRIEVGYGLEGALTDAQTSRIIRNQITPQFKNGKYYEGLNAGVDGVINAIHGEGDKNGPATGPASNSMSSSNLEYIFLALLVIPGWLASILGRSKSWWAGGVIGGGIGVVLGFIFGWLFIGLSAVVLLTILGLLFDRFVSRNYEKNRARGGNPSWWAGGPWIGGGMGGGGGNNGGFGGFGGGGFGGGGSSGGW